MELGRSRERRIQPLILTNKRKWGGSTKYLSQALHSLGLNPTFTPPDILTSSFGLELTLLLLNSEFDFRRKILIDK